MEKLITYLKNSKAEFAHISWPTRAQTIAYTAIVVVIAIFVAGFIYVFDIIFSGAVDKIIS